MNLSIKEMHIDDIEFIVNYFLSSSSEALLAMGADPNKLPTKRKWINSIKNELNKPYENRKIYYIIWELNRIPIGHSNINNILFGSTANMHLHIWDSINRKKGLGIEYLKMTIPKYFSNFRLQTIKCKPYSLNPAPVKTLEEIGFEFIDYQKIVPGVICFEQFVSLYLLTREKFRNTIKQTQKKKN